MLDGIEGSTGCMKCGELFSMTLGRVLPFVSARGARGFLCQPCLEQVNHARVTLRLEPFPVPLVGYRGRALNGTPGLLSATDWARATDGRELIRFAAPRIPPQHLGLVLASLAASAWHHFHQFAPHEHRPALGLGALRAWCVGEMTAAELRSVVDEVKQAARCTHRLDTPVPHNSVMAIWAALEAAVAAHPGRTSSEASAVVEYVVCTHVEDANARGGLTRATRDEQLEALAKHIRRQVPWPAVASSRWECAPGVAFSGGAVLRLDGWEIGDAVTLEEFG